jgi:outer membrane lipoprotein-sorting protein
MSEQTSSRWRLGLLGQALALAAGLIAPGVVLAAPTDGTAPVPLPHIRPAHPHTASASPASTAVDAAQSLARPAAPLPPPDPNSPFTPEQQAALANVGAYFNSFSLMEGRFVQIAPDGSQSEGVFFLSKPGKIRFHYSPPARLDVISDGSSVAVKDGKANTQDMYPLSKTPLRYLLSGNIDLNSSKMVKAVQIASDLITVTIVEKGAFEQGTLTLIFDRKTYELRQWQITDAQGLTTSIAIFDVALNKPQTDASLYRINVYK